MRPLGDALPVNQGLGGRALSAAEPTSYPDEAPGEPERLEWSDFSPDNIAKTTRKLTGRGPNRKLARQLYQRGRRRLPPGRRRSGPSGRRLFAAAAPQFAEAAERWPDSALAMDGLFMAGESYFFADDYPQANKHYEKLVKAFPNNRYMDVVDQRRFAIAKYWLDLNQREPRGGSTTSTSSTARGPGSDARGSGLRVFDKIRVDDPTGRFSDDATLAAANEHFWRGKFYKADEYYSDLRKAYPTSEHQFLAHFLGLKAKLNSYQRPGLRRHAARRGREAHQANAPAVPAGIRAGTRIPRPGRRPSPLSQGPAAGVPGRVLRPPRRIPGRVALLLTRIVQRVPRYAAGPAGQERIGQIAGLPPVPPQEPSGSSTCSRKATRSSRCWTRPSGRREAQRGNGGSPPGSLQQPCGGAAP